MLEVAYYYYLLIVGIAAIAQVAILMIFLHQVRLLSMMDCCFTTGIIIAVKLSVMAVELFVIFVFQLAQETVDLSVTVVEEHVFVLTQIIVTAVAIKGHVFVVLAQQLV